MKTTLRCQMLAHPIAGMAGPHILRCPTTPYRFHYHGSAAPHWICAHRHESVTAAVACTVKSQKDAPR